MSRGNMTVSVEVTMSVWYSPQLSPLIPCGADTMDKNTWRRTIQGTDPWHFTYSPTNSLHLVSARLLHSISWLHYHLINTAVEPLHLCHIPPTTHLLKSRYDASLQKLSYFTDTHAIIQVLDVVWTERNCKGFKQWADKWKSIMH